MASRFLSALAEAKAREYMLVGARGDGKTHTAFAGMVFHAKEHQRRGYQLPTRWMGAADTFRSHQLKTVPSLQDRLWQGCWRIRDAGSLGVFELGGTELVHLRLFGVEDQSGMDRLRAECHGLWFEEPAPSSVLVQSSGLSESAWGLGLTSQRLPSYAHPAVMTLNYPDVDHWTWKRFIADRTEPYGPGEQEGSYYFRIPPGELASAEQRAEWERALANRPDMLRRLLRGQPGTVILGPQVARGFNRDVHVKRVSPDPHVPLWLGQDGGHTPTTVLGQRVGHACRILAALSSDYGGVREHVRDLVRPWLGEHFPQALEGRVELYGRYDPSMNTDDFGSIETNPLHILKSSLRAHWQPGPVNWAGRLNPLLEVLGTLHNGEPALQVDPTHAGGLVKALDGAWYYAQDAQGHLRKADTKSEPVQPKKPNHPWEDYGDAFAYLVAGMLPTAPQRPQDAFGRPIKPKVLGANWNPHKGL